MSLRVLLSAALLLGVACTTERTVDTPTTPIPELPPGNRDPVPNPEPGGDSLDDSLPEDSISNPNPNPIPEIPPDTAGENPVPLDTSGLCSGICNASPASIPVITDSLSHGDVTTYGSVVDPAPSQGGACNYGATGVYSFAAIQVHQLPGDLKGQWQEGRACGQCVEASLRSTTGWKTTVVRIMDKCPDAHCGIDLGGAPAKALMGDAPGRYSGKWRFVSCRGHGEVSDGPASLFIKEGSNPYWGLVQARNAEERISAIRMRKTNPAASQEWQNLPWAAEAENFFKVPAAILQDSAVYEVQVVLPSGPRYAMTLKGSDLSVEKAVLPLKDF